MGKKGSGAKKKAKQKQKQKQKEKLPTLKTLHEDDLHGTSEELDDDERIQISNDIDNEANIRDSATSVTPKRSSQAIKENGELDIDGLYQQYVGNLDNFLGDSESGLIDETRLVREKYLSHRESLTLKYIVGQTMSQMQYEEGFKFLKELLEPAELRMVLSHFYYDNYRASLNENDYERIDLNELYKRCVVDTVPDRIAKRLRKDCSILDDQPRLLEKTESGKNEQDLSDIAGLENRNQSDLEVGLYGWGHYLQPELKKRQVMNEMVYWYKLKLLSSRLDGCIAAMREIF